MEIVTESFVIRRVGDNAIVADGEHQAPGIFPGVPVAVHTESMPVGEVHLGMQHVEQQGSKAVAMPSESAPLAAMAAAAVTKPCG